MKFDTEEFINILKGLHGPNLFNPYTDICKVYDTYTGFELVDAPNVRTNNLRQFLNKLDTMDSMLVGEAPGYRGCRRTGYAFTDEFTHELAKDIFGVDLEIATNADQPGKIKMKEPSANFMWRVMKQIKNPPFLWNIVPLHPYLNDSSQLTNRAPKKSDFELTEKAIRYLLDHGDFRVIHAVGRHAEKHLTQLGYDVKYIRHPSHGGSNIFREKIFEEYEMLNKPVQQPIEQQSLEDIKW